jgi:HD-like signal output (HDOD) protein
MKSIKLLRDRAEELGVRLRSLEIVQIPLLADLAFRAVMSKINRRSNDVARAISSCPVIVGRILAFVESRARSKRRERTCVAPHSSASRRAERLT